MVRFRVRVRVNDLKVATAETYRHLQVAMVATYSRSHIANQTRLRLFKKTSDKTFDGQKVTESVLALLTMM